MARLQEQALHAGLDTNTGLQFSMPGQTPLACTSQDTYAAYRVQWLSAAPKCVWALWCTAAAVTPSLLTFVTAK